MELSCEDILSRMEVPSHNNVFYIGKGAVQVSLLAQQYRALNLVWALKRERDLGLDFKLAVIGGGLAGITAALTAHLLGAQVSLIEEKPEPMHLQRGSRLRYLHPYVSTWPFTDLASQITQLPVLNWSAGPAAFVSETILSQWDYFAGSISQFYNHEVTDISCFDGGCSVTAQNRLAPDKNATNHQTASYDGVIIAIGFGLENHFPNVPILSYWENDNLSQPVITGRLPRRYLISGCGDGGLIDAIRLSLADFDHGRFTNLILSSDGLSEIKGKLMQIEKDARTLIKSESITKRVHEKQQLSQNEHGSSDAVLESIAGQYLSDQYSLLDVPADIEREVRSSLRSDTEVIINGRGVTPLRLDASIFNRFAIHLLRRWGRLQYRQGKLTDVKVSCDGTLRSTIVRAGFEDQQVPVDEVIIRHGPKTTLSRLFSKEVAHSLTVPTDESPDLLTQKSFPDDLLKHSLLDELQRYVFIRHAASNFLDMCQNHATPANLIEAGIQFQGEKLSYSVKNSTQWSTAKSEFVGVPVSLSGPNGRSYVRVTRTHTPILSPATEIGIRTDQALNVRAISCFVRKDDEIGGPLLILPGIPAAKKGDSMVDLAAPDRQIGSVYDVSVLQSMPTGSSPADPTTPANSFDFCVASIGDDQTFDLDIKFLTSTIKILGVRKPKVGLRVCRYIDDRKVYARIVATGSRVPVTSFDGSVHLFKNVTICELERQASPTSGIAGGASYDENGYVVGLPLGSNPKHWLEAPFVNLLSTRGLLLCSSVDKDSAREELLLRGLEFKKGRLERHHIYRDTGTEITDYLSVGDCFYYLDESARLVVLGAFNKLQQDGLIDLPSGADVWKLSPKGFEEAQRLQELRQTRNYE